jgi:dipeptidyl-peptidase-4
VYVHATRPDVLERRLLAVLLDGAAAPRELTPEPGWHEAVVSPDGRLFVDRHSHLAAAPVVTVRRLPDGAPRAVLYQDAAATAVALGLPPPELTAFQTANGVTLHAAIYAPPGAAEAGRRFPLVVSVYGGPHAQMVANRWDLTVDLRAQYLARQGFVVLKVDNRGSANRGLAFESAIARRMGHVEIEDQLAGVRFLATRPYVDAARVGIYGWSYGGYMTCLALMRAPDTFKAGVAGAPVTHWDGYDTHYAERYMGLPAANEAGYRESSVLAHVGALRGKLLLVHGLVDENVHFRHTARLIVALTAAQKTYDLLLFPEERHGPRDAQGLLYQERRLVDYFEANL